MFHHVFSLGSRNEERRVIDPRVSRSSAEINSQYFLLPLISSRIKYSFYSHPQKNLELERAVSFVRGQDGAG